MGAITAAFLLFVMGAWVWVELAKHAHRTALASATDESALAVANLQIQHELAELTLVMLLATVGGVIVAIAGVFFVAITILDARSLFIAERRAWIRVGADIDRNAYDGVFPGTKETDWTDIMLTTENVGQLPAINVTVHLEPSIWRFTKEHVAGLRAAISDRRKVTPDVSRTLFPSESVTNRFMIQVGSHEENTERYITRSLYGWAEYQVAEGGELHFTPFILDLVVYRPSNRDGSLTIDDEARSYVWTSNLSLPPD